jgi:predicted regulator of Ras-like GTPase activity (Roadblock/LC7/MglB family)
MNTNGKAMNEDVVRGNASSLNWLLEDLVKRLAGAERAVALSADGLLLGRSASLDRENGEHLAAMASAFRSLARGVGTQFDKGLVQQTVVELEYGYLVVTEAGEGACLALLASENADLGIITLVVAVRPEADVAALDREYGEILRMCQRRPLSIAEISAQMGLLLAAVKVLVSDLISSGHLIFRSPPPPTTGRPDIKLLQAVLDGVRNL